MAEPRSAQNVSAFMATGEGYRAVRRAIADPGAFVTRTGDSYGLESLTDWQTRAVMCALGRRAVASDQKQAGSEGA